MLYPFFVVAIRSFYHAFYGLSSSHSLHPSHLGSSRSNLTHLTIFIPSGVASMMGNLLNGNEEQLRCFFLQTRHIEPFGVYSIRCDI